MMSNLSALYFQSVGVLGYVGDFEKPWELNTAMADFLVYFELGLCTAALNLTLCSTISTVCLFLLRPTY